MKNKLYRIVLIQSILATLGSLYYGWFGDPVANIYYGELFLSINGLTPCQMCWFARVLMYPIVIIVSVGYAKKTFDTLSVLILSGLGILLESYQYRFQMSHSNTEVKSFLCGVSPDSSCAATDIIYRGFITIPFLCLIAFIVIFVSTWYIHKNRNTTKPH